MYYSCKEHVDMAIDEVVDETEMPPELELLEKEIEVNCSFCKASALYKISG